MFITAFLAVLRRRRIERAALFALARLDDRTLADLGLARGRIPAYARGRGR